MQREYVVVYLVKGTALSPSTCERCAVWDRRETFLNALVGLHTFVDIGGMLELSAKVIR